MIGQTIQDKGMSKVWDKVDKERNSSLPKPETKLPKTPQEGKTQNFTQFAKEK